MLMNGGETATEVNGYSQGRADVKEEGTQMHGESSTSNQGMSVCTRVTRRCGVQRSTKLLGIDRAANLPNRYSSLC